jgi:hypothetical protein
MQNVAPARSIRLFTGLLLALGWLFALGCANGEFRPKDPFDRNLTFGEAQHQYTVLIRWAEFQKAKAFVVEEERERFLADMKALKDARLTDYESEQVEVDDEGKNKATVHVTYTLYLPSSPYETQITEVQEWTREGMGNTWLVRPHFESLPSVAANHP